MKSPFVSRAEQRRKARELGRDTLGLSIKSTTQSQELRREELKECTATCDKTDSMRAQHAEGGLRGTGLNLGLR